MEVRWLTPAVHLGRQQSPVVDQLSHQPSANRPGPPRLRRLAAVPVRSGPQTVAPTVGVEVADDVLKGADTVRLRRQADQLLHRLFAWNVDLQHRARNDAFDQVVLSL